MPYTYDDPPATVKNLPVGAQHVYIDTFNAVYAKTKDEQQARMAAWYQVKRKYHKSGEQWVKNEGMSDTVELVDADKFELFETEYDEQVMMAKWTTEYKNNLPDSCFAVIESGGSKDSEGKSTPRSLRHLPYKGESGVIDREHLVNALAQLPKTDISSELKVRARRKLASAVRAWNRAHPTDKIKSEIVEMQALLEARQITLVEGFVKVEGGVAHINFNRRIPERDIFVEARLEQLCQPTVEHQVKLQFDYRAVEGKTGHPTKVYDLVLVPRDEDDE